MRLSKVFELGLALACAALPLLVACSAKEPQPDRKGRIAFERLRFQNTPWGDLFVANLDGTDVKRITHPSNGTEDTYPDWSLDGSHIVFVRQPSQGAFSIWSVRPDGTRLRRLSPPCPAGIGIPKCPADDAWPVWSPDGKQIAFQRLSGALRPKGASVNDAKAIYRDELMIADADGRHARTLVWGGPWRGDPQAPAWSPDGKRLVFIGEHMNSKTIGTGCECRALYVVNADGSGLRRILAPGLRPGGQPDWAPDGSAILFRTHPGDDPSGIGANLYTIHPDGTGLEQLTHFASSARVLDGGYSPDGKSIIFETSNGAVGGAFPDIFVMNLDGTKMRPVTRTQTFETGADWGPGTR
jgi:TolB protein